MSDPPAIRIDLASPVPAYRQIADAVRSVLVAGELAEGEQLPPVRDLAVELGVHHNTVAEAYRTLASEGWLDLTRGRGATVRARKAPRASQDEQQRFLARLRALLSEAKAAGVPREAIATELQRWQAADSPRSKP